MRPSVVRPRPEEAWAASLPARWPSGQIVAATRRRRAVCRHVREGRVAGSRTSPRGCRPGRRAHRPAPRTARTSRHQVNVEIVEWFTVDRHGAVVDGHDVAGYADHAFDEILRVDGDHAEVSNGTDDRRRCVRRGPSGVGSEDPAVRTQPTSPALGHRPQPSTHREGKATRTVRRHYGAAPSWPCRDGASGVAVPIFVLTSEDGSHRSTSPPHPGDRG